MSVIGKKESKLRLVVAGEDFSVKRTEAVKSSIISSSSRVLKAESLQKAESSIRVSPYVSSSVLPQTVSSQESVETLKANLKSLSQLHSRLRFMLQELETLIQE
jgi:hypothetical protein